MKIDVKQFALTLKREEGLVHHAYKDSEGFLTIGYGRMIDKRKGGGISDDEAEYLLNNDIEDILTKLAIAIPWICQLDAVRQAALALMAYQMGVQGLLEFKQTLSAVRDGRYDHAENLALQSLWAKQTPARARRVARQIATGEWQ